MRILSLGFPLPGTVLDNYTFLNAPSFFDYDAIVVDPRAISQLIDDIESGVGDHTSHSGERIVNADGAPDCVPLAEVLHNRSDETRRLLDGGGVVLCLAVPNAMHGSIQGLPSFGRYDWLPMTSNLSYDAPFMKRGGGTEFAPLDMDEPFGAALAQMKHRLAYQVHFDEQAPGFAGKVIARSTGGVAIAIVLPVGGGNLILLPPPARALDSQGRYQVSEAIQQAMKQLLRLSAASSAPRWLNEYVLPGLDRVVAERDSARTQVTEAKRALDAALTSIDQIERHRSILWEEGRTGLENAVRASLTLLGFKVIPSEPDVPATIELPGPGLSRRVALLETEGSEEAVGLDIHYRMRRRMEDALVQGQTLRGIAIISGYRRSRPMERAPQFTNELRMASEQLRYCLATTVQLFHAVRASLDSDTATVESFRERLLTSEGVLPED